MICRVRESVEVVYYLTGPSFKEIALQLGNGKKLIISAPDASSENIYVQSVYLNGKKWEKPWFTHNEIKNGGSIKFLMGNTPKQ